MYFFKLKFHSKVNFTEQFKLDSSSSYFCPATDMLVTDIEAKHTGLKTLLRRAIRLVFFISSAVTATAFISDDVLLKSTVDGGVGSCKSKIVSGVHVTVAVGDTFIAKAMN